ncbi:GNAT family N-acetyltransferase [Salisediminibacterium beveridgei]|uniref:N-acetyltransferase domain-containing protein n=1 Tax=Salisediminibacterium beveridgei TaxID=632773 RepID=A0A1D7QWF7_9BACI|nr:GNAT family N-acetyltransferase [Salisediminibacterium beveridgei]AOM83341.1 hypothetical protein BBEV_1980 [Salisediminibacterium beveridgei]
MTEVTIADSKKEKDAVYAIRRRVFIEEQRVPESIEIDALEKDAMHFLATCDDVPCGAGRLRFSGNQGKAERVCVLKEKRNQGIGAIIMKKMEEISVENGCASLILNAQTHAEPFYHHIGYETISDIFLDAGIEHVTMEKKF